MMTVVAVGQWAGALVEAVTVHRPAAAMMITVAGTVLGWCPSTVQDDPAQNRQEIDKSALQRIRRPAKSLLELVELTGIEPVTS